MNIRKTVHCALVALVCVSAHAAAGDELSDHPGDYSHAIPLALSGKNAVLQVRLPREVYLHSRSAMLDDLRVFDANGKALPYALVAPATQSQPARLKFPLKIFQVGMAPGDKHDTTNDMEVKTTTDGATVSVITRNGVRGRAATPAALVLDTGSAAGATGPIFDRLVFALPDGVTNYEAQVQLDVSDDQQRWETIGYASLSWLANSNRDTLTSNRIDFDPRAFRYARLSWRQGAPIAFSSIVAEAQGPTVPVAAFESVTLKPGQGRFPSDLVYEAPVAIPVQGLNLVFAEHNIVMPALLGQYIELAKPHRSAARLLFVPRVQATFFQISQDGRERSSGDISIGEAHAQSWVLRPQEPMLARPDLKLSWNAASMVFMAGGAAPYTLRFGRPNAIPGQRPLSHVAPGFTAAELQALEHAVPGAMMLNAGQPGEAHDGASARWRLAALWSVLLLGVGVLGFMAWRLFAQMKEPG